MFCFAFFNNILSILLAIVLDTIVGDPKWSYHPVRCMGLICGLFEKVLRKLIKNRYISGFFTWFFSLLVITGITILLLFGINEFPEYIQILIHGIIVYFCLAIKDLFTHGLAVKEALGEKKIFVARKRLSLMVSRDTDMLNEKQIIRSVIESISENISDSVIAPILYALLWGPIGAVVYRAINTMDAMFGYKNEKYRQFGFIAAKMDDLFNLLPSRMSGLFIALLSPLSGGSIKNAFHILARDSRKHSSPNSGFPESAVAGALGIQIGGPTSYHGQLHHKPTIGEPLIPLTPDLISRTCYLTAVPVAAIFISGLIYIIAFYFTV